MPTKFSDLGITAKTKAFVGTKMPIDRILNTEIMVHAFRIEPSKKVEGTTCLYLQISLNGIKHVTFTGSKILQQMIQEVSSEKFPITTTIVKDDRALSFT